MARRRIRFTHQNLRRKVRNIQIMSTYTFTHVYTQQRYGRTAEKQRKPRKISTSCDWWANALSWSVRFAASCRWNFDASRPRQSASCPESVPARQVACVMACRRRAIFVAMLRKEGTVYFFMGSRMVRGVHLGSRRKGGQPLDAAETPGTTFCPRPAYRRPVEAMMLRTSSSRELDRVESGR